MTTAGPDSPGTQRTTNGFFAEPPRDYMLRCLGRPITLLQAGCLAPLRELGIGELTDCGFEVSVTAVDADHPAIIVGAITCAAISRLTRGRFGDSHDELLYVIRRPQDQLARVV